MATSTLPTGGMIDPTKQAEYPVFLGDRLSRKDALSRSRLINLNYNYKTKSTSAQQTIARSPQSRDLYNLTITDKTPNADNTLTYTYEGSVDPEQAAGESEAQEYVLVFDSNRKAFVLEPVTTQLNFNLRSAPAKTEKQVMEQYEQLRTLQLDDQPASGDDQILDGIAEDDEGPPDESNPYDFRHFLPKEDDENEKSDVDHVLPDTLTPNTKPGTPSAPVTTKPAPSPKSRPKTQTNPLRPKKAEPAKKKTEPLKKKTEPPQPPPSAKPEPEPESRVAVEEAEEPESKSTPSDTGIAALSSQRAAPSPGSNIIVDGDLIIDMGSPPPTRRTFNINPAHFSSNNTPANGAEEDEGGDEEMEDLRLPSPAGNITQSTSVGRQEDAAPTGPAKEEEVEDDDALAAEMEAAFEESALEEENAPTTQPYQQRQYNVPSEDESEVSEEE